MAKQPKYMLVFAGHDDAAAMAEYARIAWAETLAELEANDLVTKSRLNTLDRYVRARTEYEFLYAIAMCEGPTLQAESGGQYANMRYAAVAKLNDQIMKFEDSLMLSPKAAGDKLQPKPQEARATKADKYLARSEKTH